MLNDDPLAKQIAVSFGLGIFGYRDYFVGGLGLDLTYLSRYFFAVSGKVYACDHLDSSSHDRKTAPFYDVTGYLHLSDKVIPAYPDVRISGGLLFGRAIYLSSVPARARQMYSLRGGVFSFGAISPTAFAGLSSMVAEYLSTYVQAVDENRTLVEHVVLYLDALFPTTDSSHSHKDRIGGRLGVEMKGRNVKDVWNLWCGFDAGYLRHGFIGRFLIGFTI